MPTDEKSGDLPPQGDRGDLRPPQGMLLGKDDPRVIAAYRGLGALGEQAANADWRDVSEVVMAVLLADDQLRAAFPRTDFG